MGLSKSKFMAGWQCLKRLYLEVHQPGLAAEPDEQSLAVFEQGYEVVRAKDDPVRSKAVFSVV